jgi:hypothetical protein
MFNAQSIDYIHRKGNIVIYSFSLQLESFLLKNEARFTTILSDIRLDMKAKMIDNQIGRPIEYPKVSLIYFIYDKICFMCRIFNKEKLILPNENMLNKYGAFFILVIVN